MREQPSTITTPSQAPASEPLIVADSHVNSSRRALLIAMLGLSSDIASAVPKIKSMETALDDLGITAGSIHEVVEGSDGRLRLKQGGRLAHKLENSSRPVASLTKLLTVIVASDIIRDYKVDRKTRHQIIESDISSKSHTKSIKVGDAFNLVELIKLALIGSSNEAAEALTRILGAKLQGKGSASVRFIDKMNKTAGQFGMRRSRFDSPSGLSDNNISTPAEINILTLAAYNYDKEHTFGEYSTNEMGSYVGRKPKERKNANNILLKRIVKGPTYVALIQKTGYIKESGKCITILVQNVKDTGRMFLITLLDSTPEAKSRSQADEMRRSKVIAILEKLKTVK